MALVPCRECNNQISSEAKVCPSCGIKTPYIKPAEKVSLADYCAGLVGLFVIVLGIGLCNHFTSDDEEPSAVAKTKSDKPVSLKEQIKVLPDVCTAYIFMTLLSGGVEVRHWGKKGAWRKGRYNYASQRVALNNNERVKIICCVDRKTRRSGVWSITDLKTNQTKAMYGKVSCRDKPR